MIVSEETLQCGQANPLLNGGHAERVPEDVWGNPPVYLRPVCCDWTHKLAATAGLWVQSAAAAAGAATV